MIEIVVFSALLFLGFGWFTLNILKIRQNILLGRDVNRSANTLERWRTMILVAFGQKKMFSRPIPALLHLALYVAFVITQLEFMNMRCFPVIPSAIISINSN